MTLAIEDYAGINTRDRTVDRTSHRARWLIAAAVLPALSYLLARAIMLGPESGPWAYWPINGLLCGMLYRRTYRDWLPIGLLAVISQVLTIYIVRGDVAGGATVVGAIMGFVQAGLAAFALRRVSRAETPFTNPVEFAWFVAIAVVLVPLAITPISGAAFAGALNLTFAASWGPLFVGNSLSMLLFAPPVMCARGPRSGAPLLSAHGLELVFGQAAIFALAVVTFASPPFLLLYAVLPYAMFPFLAWSALRCGARWTTLAVIGVSSVAAWCTAHGLGPFAGEGQTLSSSVLQVQVYLALLALTALLLSALSAQLRRAFESAALQVAIRDGFLEGSTAVLMLKNLDGNTVIANRAFAELVSRPQEELFGKPSTSFMSEAEARTTRAREQRVIEARQPMTFDETFMVAGMPRQFVVTRFPVNDANGELRYLGVIAREVTVERQVTERLQRAQRVEMVGQLAAGVAHDLNNLLSTVVLSTGLIKDALASSPENAEIANELETAAKNATKLTGRLLSLGRQGKPRQAEIHVDRAIRELEPMLHVLVRGFITLRINLRADDAVIVADPLAIEQVVLNLVSNARDAIASEGSIAVTTELVRREDTTWVRLRVEDSGAGMDQATLASIFEPFFSTKGERGSGLGLYTTATLVRQAGGHIEATSTPGAGTTFVVDLPVKTP